MPLKNWNPIVLRRRIAELEFELAQVRWENSMLLKSVGELGQAVRDLACELHGQRAVERSITEGAKVGRN